MRSIALLPGDLFTNSRLCEICSTAASRFDASAVHETTSGAIPLRNSLIYFRFFFRVLGAGWKKKKAMEFELPKNIHRGDDVRLLPGLLMCPLGPCIQKGRWLSLSSLYRRSVERENDALCQISFYFSKRDGRLLKIACRGIMMIIFFSFLSLSVGDWKKELLFHFVLIVIFFDYYCLAFYSTPVFLFPRWRLHNSSVPTSWVGNL